MEEKEFQFCFTLIQITLCVGVYVCLFVHVSAYRQHAGATNESTLSLFFRSLLPNFNLQVSCMDQYRGPNWDIVYLLRLACFYIYAC